MKLESLLNKVWKDTKINIKSKRYLQNYPNDILAVNLSRTPFYATMDNALLGVSDGQVIGSVVNSLIGSCLGWSLAYTFGNSMFATSLGKIYQKHAKKIDAVYSATMAFGFGMAVNLGAGYNLREAVTASAFRAALALPLGPITRYYTDSFRDMRGEQSIAKDTQFKNKNWKYKLPRLTAMVAIPLFLMGGTLKITPNKNEKSQEYFCHYQALDKNNLEKQSTKELIEEIQ